MEINGSFKGMGNVVELKVTDPRHFSEKPEGQIEGNSGFSSYLRSAIEEVNNLQVDSKKLSEKMITDPDSVDIHSVMIAGQKAEMSLTLTKAIRDEAIKAYRELSNLR